MNYSVSIACDLKYLEATVYWSIVLYMYPIWPLSNCWIHRQNFCYSLFFNIPHFLYFVNKVMFHHHLYHSECYQYQPCLLWHLISCFSLQWMFLAPFLPLSELEACMVGCTKFLQLDVYDVPRKLWIESPLKEKKKLNSKTLTNTKIAP